MGILNDLLRKVQTVNDGLESGMMVRDVLEPHANLILQLQQEQLFAGKRSDGEDIRPYYTEDLKPSGYFNSRETAENYVAWKGSLSYPYEAKRNPDAPNLYINGRFHNELTVSFGPDALAIHGTTSFSNEIVAKYGLDTFGLTVENWNYIFVDANAYNDLINDIKRELYG